ncbi:MAG: 4Fe-4S ferredoxin, partial [Pseudomonadota bacterium]
MLEQVREHVRKLFDEGKISGFLGLRDMQGGILPHVYENAQHLDDGFTLGARENKSPGRYPMAKLALALARRYTDKHFGVLVRGCDDRALFELLRWNQVPGLAERIVRVGFACRQELADAHECRKPYPEEMVVGE